MDNKLKSSGNVSRRKFLGNTAVAAAAVSLVPLNSAFKSAPRNIAADKPDSNFGGVQIGTITYSWRSMPGGMENIIKYCNETGISSIELMSNDLEEYLGAPKNPMMGMFGPDLSNYEGTNMGDLPSDYFFHRAGMINLTRYLSKMYVGKNINVNCISPGGLFDNQPARFLENYCKKVPIGRMANNDDIKGLVVLLASKAGGYINGENILMDGGLNA